MASMGFIKNKTQETKQPNALVPLNFTHAHAIGQTGCGKTSSFIYPNLSYRIKKNHSILLFDFKGKEHLALKYFASIHQKEDKVIEIGKPWGAKINLLRMMSPNTLERFVETMIGTDAKDPYWPKSATRLFLNLFSVIKYIEKIHHSLQIEKDKQRFKKYMNFEDELEYIDSTYPTVATFNSVLHIAQNEENLAAFVGNLGQLTRRIDDFFYECLYNKHQEKKESSKLVIKKFAQPLKYYIELKKVISITQNKLSGYEKVNGENPKISIIMNLAPLNVIANDESLNTDGYNIIDALNTGALISINTRDMSDEFAQGLSTAIFSELSKRSLLSELQPISVFIDEAQRVMNKGSDYSLDVLRECKVELFLAYQNKELMEDKLGETKYKALKQNLSSSFYFRNEESTLEIQTNELKDFEAFSTKNGFQKSLLFRPIFIKQDALFEVEQNYLQKLGVYKTYQLQYYKETHTIVYDKLNFEDEKIILFDIKTKKSRLKTFIKRSESTATYRFAMQMYRQAQEHSKKTLNY